MSLVESVQRNPEAFFGSDLSVLRDELKTKPQQVAESFFSALSDKTWLKSLDAERGRKLLENGFLVTPANFILKDSECLQVFCKRMDKVLKQFEQPFSLKRVHYDENKETCYAVAYSYERSEFLESEALVSEYENSDLSVKNFYLFAYGLMQETSEFNFLLDEPMSLTATWDRNDLYDLGVMQEDWSLFEKIVALYRKELDEKRFAEFVQSKHSSWIASKLDREKLQTFYSSMYK